VIPLSAISDSDAKELFWFVENKFVGRSRPENPLLWQAELGEFDVTVIDDVGRSDKVRLSTTLATTHIN